MDATKDGVSLHFSRGFEFSAVVVEQGYGRSFTGGGGSNSVLARTGSHTRRQRRHHARSKRRHLSCAERTVKSGGHGRVAKERRERDAFREKKSAERRLLDRFVHVRVLARQVIRVLKGTKRRTDELFQLEILNDEIVLHRLGGVRSRDGSFLGARLGLVRRLRGEENRLGDGTAARARRPAGCGVILILAPFALAIVLALDTSLEALAVLFQARALLAVATLGVTSVVTLFTENFARESVRVSQLDLVSRLVDNVGVGHRVLARETRAILAVGSRGEAFAVQL